MENGPVHFRESQSTGILRLPGRCAELIKFDIGSRESSLCAIGLMHIVQMHEIS